MSNGAQNIRAQDEKKGKRKIKKSLRRVNEGNKQLLMTSLFSPRIRQSPDTSTVKMNMDAKMVEDIAYVDVKEDAKPSE